MEILWRKYLRDKWNSIKSGDSIIGFLVAGAVWSIIWPFNPLGRFHPFNIFIGFMIGFIVYIYGDILHHQLERFRENYVRE